MILNKTYYQTLRDKFQNVQTLSIDSLDNSVDLSVKMILEHYRKNEFLHINFQNAKESILLVAQQLFIEFANDIYLNHIDFPKLIVGKTILRDERKYADGKRKDYLLRSVAGNKYILFDKKNSVEIKKSYDELLKNFTPIEQGVQQKTITNYTKYFEELNGGKQREFTPTSFEMKSVFISKKPLWDSLGIKNKIPSTYFPNPREESHLTETRSIPALSDCMIYFTPKYEVCYQQLLQKREKIKTIVIFDTEADKLNQIMQDQLKYKFNVIVLSNSNAPTKSELIPCWNWFNEELEIIDAL
ncbi:MAG TPA: hypothetical protein DCQ31_08690 [Bacteroidales bacterium]|nr:hypothetical protein [Bacteroidales bacterium]